jgi:cytochrome P450
MPRNGNQQFGYARRASHRMIHTVSVALRREVDEIAPAFRALIDAEITRRRAGGAAPEDDVLARCLQAQVEGDPWFTDAQIRTSLLCMVVGGPPQWPMVVPQAMEQLLRRRKRR